MSNKHPFEQTQYVKWRTNRLKVWTKRFGIDFFDGKKILEVGAGHGDIGNFFSQLGAEVTCTDAQAEYVTRLKERFPHIDTFVCNLEEDFPSGPWDIIIHTGVLYHLSPEGVEFSVRKACSEGRIVLLETLVADSSDPKFCLKVHEGKKRVSTKAFDEYGSRFSASFIEKILDSIDIEYTRDDDPNLNSSFDSSMHIYDWEVKETGEWHRPQYRRMWYIQ
jgi:SAM-dependent methyltransferase